MKLNETSNEEQQQIDKLPTSWF